MAALPINQSTSKSSFAALIDADHDSLARCLTARTVPSGSAKLQCPDPIGITLMSVGAPLVCHVNSRKTPALLLTGYWGKSEVRHATPKVPELGPGELKDVVLLEETFGPLAACRERDRECSTQAANTRPLIESSLEERKNDRQATF